MHQSPQAEGGAAPASSVVEAPLVSVGTQGRRESIAPAKQKIVPVPVVKTHHGDRDNTNHSLTLPTHGGHSALN